MLKLLFNILVVYAIWQLFKMIFTVNKVQKNMHDRFNDLNERSRQAEQRSKPEKNKETGGEYIDYEEIK